MLNKTLEASCFPFFLSLSFFSFAFSGDVLHYLSVLFSISAYFQSIDFELEILFAFTIAETADLIRQIGETTRTQSSVWDQTEWVKRNWLTNEASMVRLCNEF